MDDGRRAQWLRGVLDLCVLSRLADGESYGYELSQQLDDAGLGPIRGGTLYPVLLRLQRSGMVATEWRTGDAGPARKYYRLSSDGEAALAGAVTDWRRFVDRVDHVLGEVPTS
ncbi:MAG: PadR family transcriptional regulator [Actinomycetota bacterium]|nr:PadR family transcriptional regulator [Actinomycetota bacterium]